MCIFSNESLASVNEDVYKFIFNLYNIEARKYNLPIALRLTGSRKMVMASYISNYNKTDLFLLLRELRKAKNFITGAKWLTFDWIIKEDNFIKVMEGKYRDKYTPSSRVVSEVQYKERKY